MTLTPPNPDDESEQIELTLQRLAQVRARIGAAAERSGRSAEAVRLVLVSKTIAAPRLSRFLAALPNSDVIWMGENRVQEGLPKSIDVNAACRDHDIRWSMIGHLQSNKVKDALAFATEVQSVDRLSVAVELERRLQLQGRAIDILVQVNTSREDSKFGLHPDDVPSFLHELKPLGSLRPRGFMTLAMPSQIDALVRACFRDLRVLRDRMVQDAPQGGDLIELSMGMTSDFEIAVEEGATTVRVGQAIFGARPRLGQAGRLGENR